MDPSPSNDTSALQAEIARNRQVLGMSLAEITQAVTPTPPPPNPPTPSEPPKRGSLFFFGLPAPKAARNSWGARAIYNPSDPNPVDLLWDRQQWTPDGPDGDVAGREAMRGWLTESALPTLRLRIRELGLPRESADMVVVEGGGYVLAATPNRSYGYLYLGAWEGAHTISNRNHDADAPPIHRFTALDADGLKLEKTKAQRRKAGKCVACGKRRPLRGTETCSPCLEAEARVVQAQKAARVQAQALPWNMVGMGPAFGRPRR